jgi:Fe(3+) dicitrate transport protein
MNANPLLAQQEVILVVKDHQTGFQVPECQVLRAGIVTACPEGAIALQKADTVVVFAPGYQPDTLILGSDRKQTVWLRPMELELPEYVIADTHKSGFASGKMENVEDMSIYSGKKTDRIDMQQIEGNKAMNVSRQLYSRVSGITIWESDGSGLQLGIGGRGLSPQRTSNFNTRQNGYDIAADALGYPESYFTPPAEAISEIRVMRGASSLQYGPQFGGTINFILREQAADQQWHVLSRQTVSRWNTFNSFTSAGLNIRKWSLMGYYHHREGDSWRPNGGFRSNNAYGAFTYRFSAETSLRAEITHLRYVAQQPGGLTDAQFNSDPAVSWRSRNWFDVLWNVGAITFNHKPNSKLEFRSTAFGLLAHRKALGFLGQIHRLDPGEERELIDTRFNNWGNESKMLFRYRIDTVRATLLAGIRYYQGLTTNSQGVSSGNADADFTYIDSLELSSNHRFPGRNVAVYAENLMLFGNRLAVTPGARYEYIETNAIGTYQSVIKDLAGNIIESRTINDDRVRRRNIFLAGLGAEYHLTEWLESYGNFSMNYRAITFNDMRITNPGYRIDENLQDERGFSADLGVRGTLRKTLYLDVNAFVVNYANRIGEKSTTDPATYQVYLYRTNIGSSISYGAECISEISVVGMVKKFPPKADVRLFVNYAYTQAVYTRSAFSQIVGNQVEYVPAHQLKTGISAKLKGVSVSYQLTSVSEQFSDATNTEYELQAINGIIPGYMVHDVAVKARWKMLQLEAGVNNVLDARYFTRRATGYPGPGILPADIRSFYLTLQVELTGKK